MNLKLKNIAPLQAGKMLGAFYGLLSLVFVPFVLVAMAIGGMAAHNTGNTTPMPFMFGMGIGFAIFLPVMYAILGFVFGALGAWIYNLLAKWIGGLDLEFEPPVTPAA
jgi:hypothetical protein